MKFVVKHKTMKAGLSLMALSVGLVGWCASVKAVDQSSPVQNTLTEDEKKAGWILLFDGKSLAGWKPNEDPESFVVRDGMIVAQGRGTAIKEQAPHPKCHLFYLGADGHASFKDFELQADIKSEHHANSGIYFHTEFVQNAWPQKGFEIQIDNDPTHPKKTGSLYAVADISESPAKDNEWVHLNLKVQGKKVTIKLNDKIVVDWTEPDNFVVRHPPWFTERKLSSGTFALQGHDSESTVYFRNLKLKPVSPDTSK
jgi:hypothetical protein